MHLADIIRREINAVGDIVRAKKGENVIEVAWVTQPHHFAQSKRVHPEHGGSEVVAKPDAFESTVTHSFVVDQRM